MGELMMMKKTTSALAVAALLGTGAASAATFQANDDTSFSVGGDIQFAYIDPEGENTSFEDNASSLTFAGEQAHANGITTSFYLDFDSFGSFGDADHNDDGVHDDLDTDEYHVAFAGDFGEIVIGNEGDVIGPVTDVVDIANAGIDEQPGGGASTEVIQYHGNDFNGISYAVQAQINGETQEVDQGSNTSLAGYIEADLGALTLGAGFAERANTVNEEVYGVFASTVISGVDVAVNHVVEENLGDEDVSHTGLAAQYNYGAGGLYAALNSRSIDGQPAGTQDDFTASVFGVNYNITSNSTVGIEMASQDADNDVGDETRAYFSYGF
jgi:hypothetical protein